MLTLVQCAAFVLCVLLVVAVVRATRDPGGKKQQEPAASASDAAAATSFERDPLPWAHPEPARAKKFSPERLARRSTAREAMPARPVGTAPAPFAEPERPAPHLWTRTAPVSPRDAALRGAFRTLPQDGAAPGVHRTMMRNDSDDDLWDLVVRLRDTVEQLRADRLAQQAEIEELRAALAAAGREIQALRAPAEAPAAEPAAEPRLPHVNVYELRSLRRG